MALLRIVTKGLPQARLVSLVPKQSWQQAMASSSFNLKLVETNSSKPQPGEQFEAKNKRLNRPISPHLTAYNFTSNMGFSIFHRISGIIHYSMWTGIAGIAVLLPGNYASYLAMVESLHMPALFFLGKCAVVAPFMYHLFNGIRHLVWDGAVQLQKSQIDRSAAVVFLLTLGSTLYLSSL